MVCDFSSNLFAGPDPSRDGFHTQAGAQSFLPGADMRLRYKPLGASS
jgi:hypothetical protein